MRTISIALKGADQLRPVNDEQLTREMQSRLSGVTGVSLRQVRGRNVLLDVHLTEDEGEADVISSAVETLAEHVPAPVDTVSTKLEGATDSEKLDLIERFIVSRFGNELWID